MKLRLFTTALCVVGALGAMAGAPARADDALPAAAPVAGDITPPIVDATAPDVTVPVPPDADTADEAQAPAGDPVADPAPSPDPDPTGGPCTLGLADGGDAPSCLLDDFVALISFGVNGCCQGHGGGHWRPPVLGLADGGDSPSCAAPVTDP